jgi:hypothetical protein
LQALADREKDVQRLVSDAEAGRELAVFLPGRTDGAASASLQARLKQLAEQAGARVQSIQGLDRRDIGGTNYLGSHLALSGPITAIYGALAAIEASTPYLFVTSISIRAPAMSPDAGQTQDVELNAQLDIFGAMNVSAGSP